MARCREGVAMTTALLALALLIGLGVVTFLISLGLTGLGVLLSWMFPLTPFQGTLLQLVLFSLALVGLGVTFLFERLKDLFWDASPAASKAEEDATERSQLLERQPAVLGQQSPLSPRREYAHIGRNDPCPCGSGRKYKFCCLNKL
jgi:hypothetical protein